jgi:DNA-directed RNA polymerase subunit RPC12/RpoP
MSERIIKCPFCGAPYNKPIPDWLKAVKCEYCGTTIIIEKEVPEQRPKRKFHFDSFYDFLVKRKGVRYPADIVAGALQISGQTIFINEEGIVSGPEPLRKMVERWVSEYMDMSG